MHHATAPAHAQLCTTVHACLTTTHRACCLQGAAGSALSGFPFRAMSGVAFNYEDILAQPNKVKTPYRKITSDYVEVIKVDGKEVLKVGNGNMVHVSVQHAHLKLCMT